MPCLPLLSIHTATNPAFPHMLDLHPMQMLDSAMMHMSIVWLISDSCLAVRQSTCILLASRTKTKLVFYQASDDAHYHVILEFPCAGYTGVATQVTLIGHNDPGMTNSNMQVQPCPCPIPGGQVDHCLAEASQDLSHCLGVAICTCQAIKHISQNQETSESVRRTF